MQGVIVTVVTHGYLRGVGPITTPNRAVVCIVAVTHWGLHLSGTAESTETVLVTGGTVYNTGVGGLEGCVYLQIFDRVNCRCG